MGNKVQLPLFLSNFQGPSPSHSYQQLKQKVNLINTVFKQTHHKLMMNVELTNNTIRYEQMNWKKSTVRGTVKVGKRVNVGFSQDKEHVQKQDDIVLAYEDVNILYQEMKNLQSKPITSTPGNLTKTQSQKPTHIPTPSFTPQSSALTQTDQCCICLEKTPSMVLPCSHAFCDDCTVKYIIEADEKKCPQCRQEIKGSRESVEKQIFTVVQDEEVYEQVRFDVLQVLRNLNPRVVKNLEEFLNSK